MSELDYWNGHLLRGAVSRRAFMGRAAALGASGLAISTMLASADVLAAETPKSGGVLRLGLGGGSTTDSVDVTSYNDTVMVCVGRGLFNGVVEWGEEGKPHPELAESFEPKNGAKDWIFNLRKGVTFSNGQEFTADDAIYSLNLHRGDSKSGGAGALKPITDVKKLDKNQIQISLAAGDADLPYSLTDYHVLMVPDGFKNWAKPVGTGAFTLDKFDPGVRISLRRTRDYWKAGRGHLDGVEVTVMNDSSARLIPGAACPARQAAGACCGRRRGGQMPRGARRVRGPDRSPRRHGPAVERIQPAGRRDVASGDRDVGRRHGIGHWVCSDPKPTRRDGERLAGGRQPGDGGFRGARLDRPSIQPNFDPRSESPRGGDGGGEPRGVLLGLAALAFA